MIATHEGRAQLRAWLIVVTAIALGLSGCSGGDQPLGEPAGSTSRLQCVRAVTGTGSNELHQLELDAQGHAVVAGRFSGTIDFGDGPRHSNGGYDLFVAKFDDACRVQWALTAGGPGADLARDPTIGPDGDILITGHISGKVRLGGRTLDAGDDRALLLAKISSDGWVRWAHHEPNRGVISGSYVTHDAHGNIVAVAELRGDTGFGGGKVSERSTVDRNLIAFSAVGERLWETQWYGEGAHFVVGVEAADDGYLVVAGEFRGELDFGDGPRVSAGGADIFVAAVDARGELAWVETFGGAGDDFATSLALTPSGDIALAGGFSERVDWGEQSLTSSGLVDAFVARLDPTGQPRWARRLGGPGQDRAVFVTVGAKERIVAAARFEETIRLGGHALHSDGVADIVANIWSHDGRSLEWSEQFGNALHDVWYQLGETRDQSLVIAGGYEGRLDVLGRPLAVSEGETFFVARVRTAR